MWHLYFLLWKVNFVSLLKVVWCISEWLGVIFLGMQGDGFKITVK